MPDFVTALHRDSISQPVLMQPVSPTAYAAPVHFSETLQPDELAILSQLSAELLQNPLALQQLSDRVLELMRQDLRLQRERHHGYGRRW